MNGCASLKLAKPECAAESDALERSFVRETGPGEIRFTVDGAPESVKSRVLDALLTEHIPVRSSQGDFLEAQVRTDTELGNDYTVTAHAAVTSSDQLRSTVRFYAERTRASRTEQAVTRIDGCGFGSAGATWLSFLRAATALQPDASKRWVVKAQ
jgi:hypothetical protein